ncbi:alpha/beta hydrolase family protein [Kitasatospora sp. NPDC059327]|uniref:alpha/beta hydrolase family protein n=1 Tax=Kitasatospora sp. NPDC059327 TaxID=3346803 RepID=UPI0036B2E0F1
MSKLPWRRAAAPPLPLALALLLPVALLLGLVGPQAATAAPVPATGRAALPAAAPPDAPQVPAPTSRRPVGTTSAQLVDTGRRDPWRADAATRELMVTFWYPALSSRGARAPYMSAELSTALFGTPELATVRTGAAAGATPAPGRHPLVVLSPGFGYSRTSLTGLAEDLAARGYAVAALDHTYETAVQFPDGRVEACLICRRTDDRLGPEVTLSRARDIRFLIDRLTAPGPGPVRGLRIDPSRIGAAGHSLGGASAVEAMREDSRIRAAANLDGDFFTPLPTDGLARPVLLLSARRSNDAPGAAANWEETWKRLTGWKRWLDLPEGGHLSYCDMPWLLDAFGVRDQIPPETAHGQYGSLGGERALAATRTYLGAFFDRHLLGRPSPELNRPSANYPEVRFVK